MCEHHHHHHKHGLHPLVKVSAAFILLVCAAFLPLTGFAKFAVFFTAYLVAGADILSDAFKNILKGDVFNENFLMGIATLGAFAIKEYPEAVMVMILFQIGEYLQEKAVEKSRRSIAKLMDIRPDYANIEQNGEIIRKSPQEIEIGDIILVKTGEKIPLDGIVIEGNAVVDTSALTGEPLPRNLKAGDSAISGCINTNGVLKIKVTREFHDSTVSKILELVETASSKKAKAENFITRFARYYTPAVVFGAVLLSSVPPLFFGAEFSVWFERALTFLVISCPCALVISVPLGFFAGIGGASKSGILVKGSSYLERLAKPYAVVFDKTGTLTKGTFNVTEIHPTVGIDADKLLEITAMAETYSNHPIALSVKSFYGKPINNDNVKNVNEIAGQGIKALISSREVLAGNTKLMKNYNIKHLECKTAGTVIHTALDGKYLGYIVISDELKPDSQTAVKGLNNIVNKTVMLTGDTVNTAEVISQQLGIKEFHAQLLPADKVKKVEELLSSKDRNSSVIFVGDGINDAPVLTRADVGIAMGALGSDAAIEAADVVIMDDKPSKVYAAIEISRNTMRIVKENIVFAIGIKLLFLGLGAAGVITMWGAVFADVGVTLLAVLNSLRAFEKRVK